MMNVSQAGHMNTSGQFGQPTHALAVEHAMPPNIPPPNLVMMM